MNHECSDEVTPLPVVSLAWMRELVKFDRRNLEILATALHLSDEEKASLVVSQPLGCTSSSQVGLCDVVSLLWRRGISFASLSRHLRSGRVAKASAGRLVGSLVLGA